LNVAGEINLKHVAELVITRLDEYEVAIRAKIEKSIKEAEAKLRATEAKLD
jgi:hypothetical protein